MLPNERVAAEFIKALQSTAIECEVTFEVIGESDEINKLYSLRDKLKEQREQAFQNQAEYSRVQAKLNPQLPFQNLLDAIEQNEKVIETLILRRSCKPG